MCYRSVMIKCKFENVWWCLTAQYYFPCPAIMMIHGLIISLIFWMKTLNNWNINSNNWILGYVNQYGVIRSFAVYQSLHFFLVIRQSTPNLLSIKEMHGTGYDKDRAKIMFERCEKQWVWAVEKTSPITLFGKFEIKKTH